MKKFIRCMKKLFSKEQTTKFVVVFVFGIFLSFFSCDLNSIKYMEFLTNYTITIILTNMVDCTVSRIYRKDADPDITVMCLFFGIIITFSYAIWLFYK